MRTNKQYQCKKGYMEPTENDRTYTVKMGHTVNWTLK